MLSLAKTLVIGGAIGATILCPLCDSRIAGALTTGFVALSATADTATTRLHISGMTCGTCPVTARIALTRLPGVYSARVTLSDSLGVVQYDPARIVPREIAAQLTKMTGFATTVLPDSGKASPRSPGA
jgi:mercuric ion binding protein